MSTTAAAGSDTLTVGVLKNFPPQYQLDKQGQPSGFAVDVFEVLAERAGLVYQYRVYEDWLDLQQGLIAAEVDLVPNMGIIPSRQQLASFSAPVEIFPIVLFVRSDSTKISSLDDFSGRPLGVVRQNVGQRIAKKHGGLQTTEYLHIEDALFGLLSGEVDGVLFPKPVFIQFARGARVDDRIRIVGSPLLEVRRGIGVARGNEALLTRLNPHIETLLSSPEYRDIYAKWYGKPSPYWTARRVVSVSLPLLVAVALVLIGWRHISLRRLARTLSQDLADQTRELQISEEKFRVAFLTSPDAVNLNRLSDGLYIDVNESFCKVMGYEPEEIIGKSSLELNIWKNYEERERLVKGLQKQGYVNNLEAEFLTKDGTSIYGLMSARIIETGGEKFILSITKDISARKLSEEKYRTLISSASIGISLADANSGEIVDCNAAFAESLGYSREELIGKSQALIDSDPPGEDNLSQGFREHRDVASGEMLERQLVTKSGKLIDFDVKATRMKFSGNDVMLGFFQDITRRKKHERLMQARLQLNEKALVESRSSLLQAFVDEAEGLTESRIGFLHFLNEDQELLSSQAWSTNTLQSFCKIPSENGHYPISQAGVWVDCVRENRPVIHNDYANLEHRKGLPEGHTPVVRELVVPIYSAKKIVAVLGVGNKASDYNQDDINMLAEFGALAWDIIARKDVEEQKGELEVQLRQKYKMEAVGVMAGGIAHNFNNSLAAILGSLELAKRKLDQPEKLQQYLETATSAVLRSRDLVAQILTYSRQDADKRGLTNLGLVIEETIKLLRSTFPSTIELDYQLGAAHKLIILADPSQVEEALLNLCNNAVQAMDEQGQLQVRLDQIVVQLNDIPAQYNCKPGLYARLRVRDSGCGMDQQTMDRIFDPFFTTKGVGEGTGMGLATVQGLVNQYGGMIKVDSSPGHGSTFDLYFPLATEGTSTVTVPESPLGLPQGDERVLFVDDDAVLIDLGQEMLSELGYQVTAINDSSEALQLFRQDPAAFDLVITDQTMPGMTGEQFAAEIRRERSELPVVLCTGHSSKMNEQKAAQAGISAFMMKPLEMERLAQVVRAVLDESEV